MQEYVLCGCSRKERQHPPHLNTWGLGLRAILRQSCSRLKTIEEQREKIYPTAKTTGRKALSLSNRLVWNIIIEGTMWQILHKTGLYAAHATRYLSYPCTFFFRLHHQLTTFSLFIHVCVSTDNIKGFSDLA